MIRRMFLLGLGMTMCLSMSSSQLTAQIIDGSIVDQAIRTQAPGAQGGVIANQNINGAQVRVGRFTGGGGENVNSLYVFQLPDLGAIANPFATADLEFDFLNIDTAGAAPDYNADLYGIDARATAAVAGPNTFGDFYAGPAVDPDATLLQDSILTPTTALGNINSVDISSYLNAQYAGGAGANQFVFLRFSPDFNPNNIIDNRTGYLIAAANNATPALRPIINFTTTSVPEPSSMSILLLGAIGLVSRRRRTR